MADCKIDKYGKIKDRMNRTLGEIKDNRIKDVRGQTIGEIKGDLIKDRQCRTIGEVKGDCVRNAFGKVVCKVKDLPVASEIALPASAHAAIVHFFIKPILN